MQIDFHHAVTYVTARIAGFGHEEADIIAYSSQFVDDAVSSGVVCFDNKAMYSRISSAHKAIDPRNLDNAENHLIWLPFHFLPGNGGKKAGVDPRGSFINKIICLPNSPVAEEIVQAAILDRGRPYSLHRLGITLHVYADTWAHQGFAGVLHVINDVENVEEIGNSGGFKYVLQDILKHCLGNSVPPLGHGRALEFPDLPFLAWEYYNGQGKHISRKNTDIFCEAADSMCKAMQQYRQHSDDSVQVSGIGKKDKEMIRNLFSELKSPDGSLRHREWLKAIQDGMFSFGSASISYYEEGKYSWKAQALGTSLDVPVHSYKDSFLTSNWKLFHDALQLYRVTLLHDILPKYGICAG
jgi:hypothetical protein